MLYINFCSKQCCRNAIFAVQRASPFSGQRMFRMGLLYAFQCMATYGNKSIVLIGGEHALSGPSVNHKGLQLQYNQ